MPDVEVVDSPLAAGHAWSRGFKRQVSRPWNPLLILVVLLVLVPPVGLFAVAVQAWSGVGEEVFESPAMRALLEAAPIPGRYVCAAVFYGLGALFAAVLLIH